jgi:glycosyltransferase involved in cell wall biosynthesis
MDFFEFGTTEVTKTKRILVYPNITYSKDIQKDSYVQVERKLISELSKIRNDLFWYAITPKDNKHNSQYPIGPHKPPRNIYECVVPPYPSYPPTMRCHFDTFEIKKYLLHKYDFDLIFTHLPEHTWNLVNLLKNNTHHNVPILGYSHWFDFEHIQKWPVGAFNQNMMGLLEMDKCYINTEYQKQLVLHEARKTFNKRTVLKLSNILEPFHLGVSTDELTPPKEKSHKLIVFNHRTHSYKNFSNFIEICDKLWEMRQDFKVWIPLLDAQSVGILGQPRNRPWLDDSKFGKTEYYQKLQNCRVGFSPRQTYGGWSVATTDGLMNGCPFIMYDADYYRELNPTADFFSTDDSAISLLNKYLDDESYRNEKATESFNYVSENLLYENSIKIISNDIDRLINKSDSVSKKSKKLKEFVSYIKNNGTVSKADLIKKTGWGRGIPFSPYRRALMNHPNIFDKMGMLPYYTWKPLDK